MEHAESVKTPEVPNVDRKQLGHAVDMHTRRQSCIVDLRALNVMRDEERALAVMNLAAVREKFEVPLDHTG